MKLSKLFLSSTTALGLSLTAVLADGNTATVDQGGNANSAFVDQDRGADGSAGAGTDQTATIDQDGDDNETDVIQEGDTNTTEVTQAGDRNRSDNTSTGARNTVTVDQGPETVNTWFGPILFGGNDNESDVAIAGDDNDVNVTQIRDGNESEVDVEGGDNDIDVTQDDSQFGDGNTSTVQIDGAGAFGGDNGSNNEVTVNQDGDNDSEVSIFGDDNDVDVDQRGRNTLTIDISGVFEGDDNTVNVDQNAGFGNDADIGIIGDGNTLNIDQAGNNTATVDIDGNGYFWGYVIPGEGDGNTVTIDQFGQNGATAGITGDNNTLDIDQDGFNTADVQLNGGVSGSLESDNNRIAVDQFGENSVTVSLWGDDNNSGSAGNDGNGVFSGDAMTVAGLDGRIAPGNLTQVGWRNSVTLNVGEPGADSDNNLFSVLQDGYDNTVTGAIRGGSGNEVAVSQVGSGHVTTFTQVGNANNLGVSQ